MISVPVLILTLLGCCLFAEVTGRVLNGLLPADVDPRVAKRVLWASRSFALLYPILEAIRVFVMLALLQPPLSDSLLAGFGMAILVSALACAPLAVVLGRSARSIAIGAIPLVAIPISPAISLAIFAILEIGPSIFLWMLVQWLVWLACTFAGLKWVVPPMWPLDTSRFLRCPACGYSRAGLTVELCPECGGELPVQPAPGTSRTG